MKTYETIESLINASEGEHYEFKELQQVLPGHSWSQIQVLLRELRKENRVFVKGKTSTAKWFVVTK